MTDKKTKMFKLLEKQNKLFNRLPIDKSCTTEDRKMISLCLTEIYVRSQHLVNLIKKISGTNLKFTEDDLDSLLDNLINLQIEIYGEVVDWIKDLKKPLNIAINKIGDLGAEKYGWD
jgi:DNA mismatch repair ATPase MutS